MEINKTYHNKTSIGKFAVRIKTHWEVMVKENHQPSGGTNYEAETHCQKCLSHHVLFIH